MTLYQFINIVKSTALKSTYINAFGQGDVYENLNSGDKQYPFCNLTIDNVSSGNDYSTVNFNLFYIDRLLTDNSNKEQVQSFAITVLNLVLNKLENNQNVNITSKTFYPFVEQFSDLCAGAYCTASVTIPGEIFCDDDSFTTRTLEITQNGTYSVEEYDDVNVDVHSDDQLKYFVLYPSNYLYANYLDLDSEIVANVKFTGDEDLYFCNDEKNLIGLYYSAVDNETYAYWDSEAVALHFHKSDWEKGYYKIQLKAGRLQIGYYTWNLGETKGSTSSFDKLYFGYKDDKTSSMEIEYITINNKYGVAYDYRPKVTGEKAELVEIVSGNIADIRTVYKQETWKNEL